ncbi:MAG TPA: hypothetical protein VGR28_03055 [Candidatus Thermoplasmatota archaeon]|nr:hypothetical protein [Candidatus Thermoplasmatota archaeon]
MRGSWAETLPRHADPALRPRSYEAAPLDVLRACARAAGDFAGFEVAEVDPRRATLSAWVRLAPFASLPIVGPRKHPGARGLGWWQRFDPLLAPGWLQVRVDPVEDPKRKGEVQVWAHVHLELPFASLLARLLLKRYLRWLDVTMGMPRTP